MGNILATQFHLEVMPETVEYLVQQYASDLEAESGCVQTESTLLHDLDTQTQNLHQIADVVYDRWLQCVY